MVSECGHLPSRGNEFQPIAMKADEQTEITCAEEANKTSARDSLREYVTSMREGLFLATESINEEFKMPRNTLITFKVGLLVQYFGLAFILMKNANLTWLVNGDINCRGHSNKVINDTEGLILSSLCRNPIYRDRFSTLFLFFEIPTMGILLLKLLIDERNFGWKLNKQIHLKLGDGTVFWFAMIPRILIYLFLPIDSALSTTTASLGTFYAIFRSPITYILSLFIRLLVFPIALFFPYPMNDFVEINLGKIAESLQDFEQKTSFLNVTGKFNCFEFCQVTFEASWCLSVCFLLINSSIVFWILNLSDARGENQRGESRENYSDGVEFIRVSEVSEDFSYEEEEGRVSATMKSDDVEKDAIEIVKSDRTGLVTSESGTVLGSRSDDVLVTKSVPDELDVTVPSRVDSEATDIVVKEAEKETKPEDVCIDNSNKEKIPDVPKETLNLKEVSSSNKFTQTISQNVNKGCQTFVPIHLHKKVNKKTQVSPIFVHAQTNTDVDKSKDAVSSVAKRPFGSTNGEHSRFKVVGSSLIEKNCDKLDVRTSFEDDEEKGVKHRNSSGASEKETKGYDKDSVELFESNGADISVGKDTTVHENGDIIYDRENMKTFGYAELTLIPRTLDFEKRIIRENQIRRMNVDSFLKYLKQEEDRDVIFVEKELLLNTFRDMMMILKVTETEEAVCPRTKDLLKKCDCAIHKLVRSLPKQEGQPVDECDGLKMETEDDYCSDDESFFNGFRL